MTTAAATHINYRSVARQFLFHLLQLKSKNLTIISISLDNNGISGSLLLTYWLCYLHTKWPFWMDLIKKNLLKKRKIFFLQNVSNVISIRRTSACRLVPFPCRRRFRYLWCNVNEPINVLLVGVAIATLWHLLWFSIDARAQMYIMSNEPIVSSETTTTTNDICIYTKRV